VDISSFLISSYQQSNLDVASPEMRSALVVIVFAIACSQIAALSDIPPEEGEQMQVCVKESR